MNEEKKNFETPVLAVTPIADVIRTSGERDDEEWDPMTYNW